MYALTDSDRQNIQAHFKLASSDEDSAHAAIEASIASSLPEIDGLKDDQTTEQRVAILSAAAAKSRAEFIKVHGNPLGQPVDKTTPSHHNSQEKSQYSRLATAGI